MIATRWEFISKLIVEAVVGVGREGIRPPDSVRTPAMVICFTYCCFWGGTILAISPRNPGGTVNWGRTLGILRVALQNGYIGDD